MDPYSAQVLAYRIDTYLTLQKYDLAGMDAIRLVKIQPDDPQAHYFLELSKLFQGKTANR
jgi:hypothetical protein